jgi:hypothetical protein
MSRERVVGLSPDQLSHVTRLAEPLAPPDRPAFLNALMSLLRTEPVQPPLSGLPSCAPGCERQSYNSGARSFRLLSIIAGVRGKIPVT